MIPKNKWSELINLLRDTLIEQATISDKEEENDAASIAERQALLKSDFAKHAALQFNPNISENDFWWLAACKPFYAGHEAEAVEERELHMKTVYLKSTTELMSADWDEGGVHYRKFLKDERCYRHPDQLKNVIRAARNIERKKSYNVPPQKKKNIIELLCDKHDDYESLEMLKIIHGRFKAALEIGDLTAFHLMLDIGLKVIKPDRHFTRMIYLLRLTDVRLDDWKIQKLARDICAETGLTIRELDIIVVKMSMSPSDHTGFMRTICNEKAPRCELCKANKICEASSIRRTQRRR